MHAGEQNMLLERLKPGVSKYWLLTLGGLVWSTTGVMLCRLAYRWFTAMRWSGAIPLGIISILLASLVYRFGFSRIARTNINRLCMLTERTCIFAFQTWRGYLIVGVMILLGSTLRGSMIPRYYLAVLYTTIGGALFLASLSYYKLLWQTVVRKEPC
jgi:hypothetical protein